MPLGKVRPNVTPKVHPAYPDTGAEQSMVSEDLIETLGLALETSTKAVEAVDGGRVTCLGSSPVELEYQGRRAQTRLLVTDALRSEVILSKTVLQKLEVIAEDFPNARSPSRDCLSGSLPETTTPSPRYGPGSRKVEVTTPSPRYGPGSRKARITTSGSRNEPGTGKEAEESEV